MFVIHLRVYTIYFLFFVQVLEYHDFYVPVEGYLMHILEILERNIV